MSDIIENLNIIILDESENFLTWLDSEKLEIKETSQENTHKKVSVTYPLENPITSYDKSWFDAGNKIFIPSTIGAEAGLYVINQDANIDFWEKNEITFEAEEVLVQLNNIVYQYVGEKSLTVNKENLQKWFGNFYSIGHVDSIPAPKNVIAPAGTMSLMKLLRLIEEETGYVFGTRYKLEDDNQISRELRLKAPENIGTTHEEYLDLNYNLESLDLTIDESETYSAMAPEISLNENTASKTSTTTQATGNGATTRKDLEKVINAWKELEVEYRENIPMIVEKGDGDAIKYTAYWYAPFAKDKGKLSIYNTNYTEAKYKTIIPYVSEDILPPQSKTGWVSTNETNEYAIYNVLANALLKKITPSFELNIDVKDIQLITGNSKFGYNLHDKIYVKVPGIEYYVGCTVTETVKNLHLPGENSIKLESNVDSLYLQEETEIKGNNQIIPSGVDTVEITGILQELVEEHKPIGGEVVTVNIKLDEAYTNPAVNSEITSTTQATTPFKPEEEYYTFTSDEIKNMANIIFNYLISKNEYPKAVNMKATNGKIYSVPFVWCRSIYYAYHQVFLHDDLDKNTGKGKFPGSVEVHKYKNPGVLVRFNDYDKYKGSRYASKYYADFFHTVININQQDIKNKYFPKSTSSINFDMVGSSDLQYGGDGVPVAVSNISEAFFDYHTEKELQKVLKTKVDSKGVPISTLMNNLKFLSEYGYTVKNMNITKENGFEIIKKYLENPCAKIRVSLNISKLEYENTSYDPNRSHSIAVMNAFIAEDGKKYLTLQDGNYADFDPIYYGISLKDNQTDVNDGMKRIVLWDEFFSALNSFYSIQNGNIYNQNETAKEKCIQVISCQTAKQKTVTNHTVTPVVSAGTFDPLNHSYTFDSEMIKYSMDELFKTNSKSKEPREYLDEIGKIEVKMKDVKGQEYKVNGRWIYAMALAYCDSYHSNDRTYTKSNYTVNKDSSTKWYYDNWLNSLFNCYNENSKERDYRGFGVYAAEGLCRVGVIKCLNDLNPKNDGTLEDIIMQSCDSRLQKFKVKFTKENLKKYLHDWTSIGLLAIDSRNIYDNSIRKYLGNIYECNVDAILVSYSPDKDRILRINGINTATPRHDGELPLWYDNFNTYKNWNDQFIEKARGLTIISRLSKEELEKL